MQRRMLGGLTPENFLRRHWQKRPLFVRGALARQRLVAVGEVLSLAARDDVESRIVERHGRRWKTQHGPFRRARPKARDWTILVSGVNLHSGAADRLLRRFSFIPQARLDDVMVSYATTGGGVGPHIDSYDVFLIQGPGRRRWTTWFAKEKQTYLCEPGDLLYLPPGVKHDGVAVDACFTYSVGFRAPRGAELAAAFLDWLNERGLPDARYRDPELAPGAPARVPGGLVDYAQRVLSRIRWSRRDVEDFLGEYLTLPKPHVVFRPSPGRGAWLRLDTKTQLLYSGARFFINGEAFSVPARDRAALRELADRREIAANRLASQASLIGQWRRAGYVRLEKKRNG